MHGQVRLEESIQWHTSMLSFWGGMSLGPGPGLHSDESDIDIGEHESVLCPQSESCPLIQSCQHDTALILQSFTKFLFWSIPC